MARSYKHLTYEQRCQIFVLKERGDSLADIARTQSVHCSTISRELRRNSSKKKYHHQPAHNQAQARKINRSPNKKMTPEIISIIEEKICLDWSPRQISGWLKKQGGKHVSHETIYKHIWADKKHGGVLYKHLRHCGKKYNKRGKGTAGRGCIPGRVDIKERPKIVEEKTRLGDWELDTIIGAQHQQAIVSMVERRTKLTKLVKISHKTAEKVKKALITKLAPIQEFVLTLTADNGKEFADHKSVSEALQANFFFATPYHSWERGLNEHTNGLVRQYFPKKMNFDVITESDIEQVEALLNNRPREILSFETPLEAFERLQKEL